MTAHHADRIVGFRLSATNPRVAADYLRVGLGFAVDHEAAPVEVSEIALRLGDTQIIVARGGVPGCDAPANSPAFHHLAIVVSDIATACAQASAFGARPISQGGPVRLPPSSGGVIAWKFRTPQGQPLELLEAPTSVWRERARESDEVFLGIDHTALGCSDLKVATAFYNALGFREGAPSHNRGPEQDALDGLDGVNLHIATLFTPSAGPHIELLHYVAPTHPGSGETDRLTITLACGEDTRALDAPDGHPLATV